ncbi:hypothetical protein JCM24511_04327 [Saitozyma sp. JCM 24511]|nr:hypothetical protein JCM24511_04327 [Saitozyma sp. JCM 24511]
MDTRYSMDYSLPEVQGDWEHPTLSAVGSRADIGDPENHAPVGSLGLVPDDEVDGDLRSMVDDLVTEPLTAEEKWWQYLESLTPGPTPLRATEGTGGVILPWRQMDVTHADVQHSRVAGRTAMTEVQRRRHIDVAATASVASSIELPDAALASAWKERLRTNAKMSQKAAARKLDPIGSSRPRPSRNESIAETSYGSRDTDLLGISTSLDAGSSGAAQSSDITSQHSLFNVPELVIDTDMPTPDAKDTNLKVEEDEDEGSDSTSRAAPESAFGSTAASAHSGSREGGSGSASGHHATGTAPWRSTGWSSTFRTFAQVAASRAAAQTTKQDKGKGVESVGGRSEDMPRSSLAPLTSGPGSRPAWNKVAGTRKGVKILRRPRRMSG